MHNGIEFNNDIMFFFDLNTQVKRDWFIEMKNKNTNYKKNNCIFTTFP